MPTVAEGIRMLHEFEARIASPVAFYEEHRIKWRDLARDTTLQTLLHLRPLETDADSWNAHAENVAAKVTATLFDDAAACGVIFDTRDWSEHVEFDMGTGEPPEQSEITVDDIERWVQAGMDGVEGGKRLKPYDAGKSARAIAYRVYRAIENQRDNWDRLLGHIHDYGGMQHSEDSDALASAVAAKWQDTLIPAIITDWTAWVAAQVAALG